MSRFLLIAAVLASGAVAAQSPLEALELDVVDQRERPDDAIQRMATKPQGRNDDDEDSSYKHLKMDWGLGKADDASAISPSDLAPLPAIEEPTLLEAADDRAHGVGHAFGRDDDKGHGGKGEGKDDGKGDDDKGDDDKGGKDDDKDDDGGKKGKGGRG